MSDLIPGAGTSLAQHDYTWMDSTVTAGSYVYRIRQVDLTGGVTTSREIVVSVVMSVNGEVAPRVFQLMQNYPNPFNPSTVIKFSVEKQEHATVKIYNTLGELVMTLFDGVAEPGRYYRLTVDGSRLSSGLYFYKITTDSRVAVKKMLMLK